MSDLAAPTSLLDTFDRRLLELLYRGAGGPRVTIVLEGRHDHEIGPTGGPSFGVVRIHDRETLFRIMLHPNLFFGEAYVDGRLGIEGDLSTVLDELNRASPRSFPRLKLQRAANAAAQRLRANTMRGSRSNIASHYNLGNDFYRLWLDERMVYTCAYFKSPQASLEQAQLDKLDHVCRKLHLRAGDRLLELGCGWGALALHAAEHYGVTVKAFNISQPQVDFARQEARRRGLDRQVSFVADDYRNATGEFDAVASIGMLEHVGPSFYGELGRVVDRVLTNEGRGLIHFIGRNRPLPDFAWLERHIFPGSHIPPLSEVIPTVLEPFDFSVVDIENLRLHYAVTLDHWLKRYQACHERIVGMFDERFYRAFQLYLAGSASAFRTGWFQLFQVLFTRPTLNDLPMTRNHLYE